MDEVVRRRYGGTLAGNDPKALPFPDLILIDGGLGQLGAALDALKTLQLNDLTVFGLAKARGEKEERIFLPGRKSPLILSAQSPATHLIQHIRDEAHRFAIRYHRKLRGNSLIPISTQKNQKTPSDQRSEINRNVLT